MASCPALVVALALACAASGGATMSFAGLSAPELGTGRTISFSRFDGRAVLISNVASHCGFTRDGLRFLNRMHSSFHKRGLDVVALPCNQFGAQMPGTPDEISSFLRETKNVAYTVLEKGDVNGASATALFRFLRGEHLVDPAERCVDGEAHCSGWAADGECDKNAGFMRSSCRASCGVCEPKVPLWCVAGRAPSAARGRHDLRPAPRAY